MQYALMFPEKVKGLILLDPATPYDEEFKARLTQREYKMSGVDKTDGYRLGLLLTSLRLGSLFIPLLKKSPPFYYHTFTREAEEYLLKSLCRRRTYITALNEYKHSHIDEYVEDIREAIEAGTLGHIPVRLVTHSSGFYIDELMKFAGIDNNIAEKVEGIWQDIMKRYLTLSTDNQHVAAPNSGHYIHLTDIEVVEGLVNLMLIANPHAS